MIKQELIKHLEHLADYVKYSEDAPALREVIEMLKCSEMPNSSEEHTQERTETHACDLISRQDAITEFSCCELTPDGGIDANYAIDFLKYLPSVQPDIVHCPDCKYGVHSGCGDRYICTVSCELRMEHDSTFYCGYGKRGKGQPELRL